MMSNRLPETLGLALPNGKTMISVMRSVHLMSIPDMELRPLRDDKERDQWLEWLPSGHRILMWPESLDVVIAPPFRKHVDLPSRVRRRIEALVGQGFECEVRLSSPLGEEGALFKIFNGWRFVAERWSFNDPFLGEGEDMEQYIREKKFYRLILALWMGAMTALVLFFLGSAAFLVTDHLGAGPLLLVSIVLLFVVGWGGNVWMTRSGQAFKKKWGVRSA